MTSIFIDLCRYFSLILTIKKVKQGNYYSSQTVWGNDAWQRFYQIVKNQNIKYKKNGKRTIRPFVIKREIELIKAIRAKHPYPVNQSWIDNKLLYKQFALIPGNLMGMPWEQIKNNWVTQWVKISPYKMKEGFEHYGIQGFDFYDPIKEGLKVGAFKTFKATSMRIDNIIADNEMEIGESEDGRGEHITVIQLRFATQEEIDKELMVRKEIEKLDRMAAWHQNKAIQYRTQRAAWRSYND